VAPLVVTKLKVKSEKCKVAAVVLVASVILALTVPRVLHRISIREAERQLERELPPAQELSTFHSELSTPLKEVNLPVPFTTQAPHANWDMPYQEACEEAAALMAIRYVFGNEILSPADADKGILDLVRANEVILGYPVDQTADQVRELIKEIDPAIQARLLADPSVFDLKKELSAGNVIIVPAAGRKLKNPFFQRPGPLYHMLVLRGFTEDGYFITNDPGTRRGEGYPYKFERIMEAMGDWNSGNPAEGEKVVVVVEPLLDD